MKQIAAVALLVSLGALQGCGGPEVETETPPKLEIEDHRIDGIDRLKITYNTEIEERLQQVLRTTHQEHYIDFSTQVFRNHIAAFKEHEVNETKSTFVEFIIDDLIYQIGQYEPDLCITKRFIRSSSRRNFLNFLWPAPVRPS